MRMGEVMMRYPYDWCLTAALSGLVITLLVLGTILVRGVGAMDISVADLRGSLP